MKILIGSNNLGKVKEYSALLGSNFDPVPLSSLGLELDVDENGATYEENALIKLNYLKSRCELPIITDDSGLEVNFLEGRPGMYSARYSGDNATDDSNIEKLLNELDAFQMQSKFPLKENHARFVCTIAYFNPSSSTLGLLINDESVYNEAKNTLQKISKLTDKLSSGDGSLGKLINDDQLYDSINTLSDNLNSLVAKINSGEGTLGKLINDDRLYYDALNSVRKLKNATETQEDLAPLTTISAAFGVMTLF